MSAQGVQATDTGRVTPLTRPSTAVPTRPSPVAEETAPADGYRDQASDLTNLEETGSAIEQKEAEARRIAELANRLMRVALSEGGRGYQEVVKVLRGVDPKDIARALHQIPVDAVVAQVVVALKYSDPSRFASTLFFLDFFSTPGKTPLLRDRVNQLIGNIILASGHSYQEEAETLFDTLGLMAKRSPELDPKRLRTLAGEQEGVMVIAVMEHRSRPGIGSVTMVVRKGYKYSSDVSDHPGSQNQYYTDFLGRRKFSDIRSVEYVDRSGHLIVRNYLMSEGAFTGSYEFREFDPEGRFVEYGEVGAFAERADPIGTGFEEPVRLPPEEPKSHRIKLGYDHLGRISWREYYSSVNATKPAMQRITIPYANDDEPSLPAL